VRVRASNGYLSVSRLYSVACRFATMSTDRLEAVSIIFEYNINLNINKTIVIADIAQYSVFSEEAEVGKMTFRTTSSFRTSVADGCYELQTKKFFKNFVTYVGMTKLN
jgi:hypothetical protein